MARNPVVPIVLVRTVQASVTALVLSRLLHWPLTGPHALGLIFTPLLCLYFVFVFVAPWSWGLPILTRLPTTDKIVALTFDDGPYPESTPQLLDILREHGAQATFFVLGEQVRQHPDLLRRIAREGHRVALHGEHHQALVLALRQNIIAEIKSVQEACLWADPENSVPTWFRPPHGFKTITLPWIVRRCGCRVALWSINPRDYQDMPPSRIAQTVMTDLHPGEIVLLHDAPDRQSTVQALPLILAGLASAGYTTALLPDASTAGDPIVKRFSL